MPNRVLNSGSSISASNRSSSYETLNQVQGDKTVITRQSQRGEGKSKEKIGIQVIDY